MAIASNADDYTNGRVGIFFPADTDGTLRDGNLTGQCVSLTKWFLAEMTTVPNPGKARGNAKDVGDTLVREGHAVQVSSPIRGDFAVWKQDGGGYGHIGVILSGNRVFEQNVGLAGTPSKKVGSNTVYASRIDPLAASWRKGAPTYYRIKSYKEAGMSQTDTADLNAIYKYGPLGRNRGAGEGEDVYLGKSAAFVLTDHANSQEGKARLASINGQAELIKQLETENTQLKKTITDKDARIKELEANQGDGGEYTEVLTANQKLYIKK